MISSGKTLGALALGTSFPDIIMNNVDAVSSGQNQGFQQFIHDPKALKETADQLGKLPIPEKFIAAVTARRVATNGINDVWRCPLNLQTPLTCPMPWTFVEAEKRMVGESTYEFMIMRTIDFIGRNYIRIVLPAVDTTKIVYGQNQVNPLDDPSKIYLGAWHRDLVPRLIEEVAFYTRSCQHKLFTYSGYDIAVHNIIFGNANKEMNDLMAGEDKFELTYDPYRVDGTALGIASYKGVDAFKEFEANEDGTFTQIASAEPIELHQDIATVGTAAGTPDGFIDYFQKDTQMDKQEYKTFYRRNVWYEAPVAVPYDCRHSIHSRRLFHRKTAIIIPLDVLPFGYSIESAIPTASIAADCGHISVKLFDNWFDRSFYLTRMSDVPTLYPIAQHKHLKEGDYVVREKAAYGSALKQTEYVTEALAEDSPLIGWVNARSIGRYGDDTFVEGEEPVPAEDRTATHNRPSGNVVGKPLEGLEGVVPTKAKPQEGVKYQGSNYGLEVQKGKWFRQGVSHTPYAANTTLDFETEEDSLITPPSKISKTFATQVKSEISVRLIQVGYVTLTSIKKLLAKLPNLYITTEWADSEIDLTSQQFTISNDLYITAMLFWFIPKDVHGIESLRVYPHQKLDTEFPLIAGLHVENEQSQGKSMYTWDMMNLQTPAHMGLKPLLSNMGIISFTPLLQPNQMPYAIYDQNFSGFIKCRFEKGEESDVYDGYVNMRKGSVKVISIGVNGIAVVNRTIYRLIF